MTLLLWFVVCIRSIPSVTPITRQWTKMVCIWNPFVRTHLVMILIFKLSLIGAFFGIKPRLNIYLDGNNENSFLSSLSRFAWLVYILRVMPQVRHLKAAWNAEFIRLLAHTCAKIFWRLNNVKHENRGINFFCKSLHNTVLHSLCACIM